MVVPTLSYDHTQVFESQIFKRAVGNAAHASRIFIGDKLHSCESTVVGEELSA